METSLYNKYPPKTMVNIKLNFSIGKGNGNPLQYSCLENPVDGGAWWAVSIGSLRAGHDQRDLAGQQTKTLHIQKHFQHFYSCWKIYVCV